MKKKIYECRRCVQFFSGKVAYDYHMNAHRRIDLPKAKELAPKRPSVYTDRDGETPRIAEGETS